MRTTIDRVGRVVIPKAIRDRWRLAPGTELEVAETDVGIELVPAEVGYDVELATKGDFLVLRGGPPVTAEEMFAVRDAQRDRRGR